MYEYTAVVRKVYDGDTITVDIDLGLGIWKTNEKIRLNGINAPEIRGKEKVEGTLSRDFLRSLILDETITIVTAKDKKGKYGRYVGTIYHGDICINEAMVTHGYAIEAQY